MNFKPTSSRKLSTKFGPDAVTGVFAGYITTSGENWRREYLAWPLADFEDADLSIDCEMVPRQLRDPIVAERISLVADKITFPLKNEYERVNTTLEGIKDVASTREGPEVLEMVDVDTPKPRLHYVSEGYLHYSEGTAGDGNIYVDDDGYNVKLDKLGRRSRARSDGVREVPTSRPLGIPPEAWARMSERERRKPSEPETQLKGKAGLRHPPKPSQRHRVKVKPLAPEIRLSLRRTNTRDMSPILNPPDFPLTLRPMKSKGLRGKGGSNLIRSLRLSPLRPA